LSDYLSLAARAAHTATWTHRNRYGYQDHRHNALDFLVLWHANRALRLGPYIRWEQFTYRESKHNDATVIDTGLALNYASSENFIVEASVGWETINMDTTNRNHFAGVGATDEGGGPSARWRVVYMQSELTAHVLGGSYRRTQGTLAPTVNYTEELHLNYGISLYPVNNVSITPGIDWIRIDESDSGECADYYRIGLALGYRLTRDILLRMRYYYENRESDVFDRDYQRNVLEFGCHWRL